VEGPPRLWDVNALLEPVLAWYAASARDLPWRRPGTSPWGVLVSELMLQQTPVVRVLPVYRTWMERWPTPAALAAEASGEAVRAWGRLGYPRRALRLHACAVAITEQHGGHVPDDRDTLLTLPGVGDYTAAAVASFAFGRSHAVLDTNVRRVLGRAVTASEFPPTSVTRAERELAEALVPDERPEVWAVAVMELGALVCTAARPRCEECPILDHCAWQHAGRPAYDGPPRRGQTYDGTDRQCRGRLLAVLRATQGSVDRPRLDEAWPHPDQRSRALAGLLDDGLVVERDGRYALPG
jgi:A/G-specific adenine glycosylase